jgi:hypothetical protein
MKAVTLLVFLLAPIKQPGDRDKKPNVADEALASCYKILKFGEEYPRGKPSKEDAVTTLGMLGMGGNERVVPLLLEQLANEESDLIRNKIINALWWLKSKKAVPLLEKALKDSYNLNRKDAARALKEITGKDYPYELLPEPPEAKLEKVPRAATPPAKTERRPSGLGSFLEKGKTYRFDFGNPQTGHLVGKVLDAPADGWVKIESRQGGKKIASWVNLRNVFSIDLDVKPGK